MINPRIIAFDFGHTLVDERRDAELPLETRPVHLMPEVLQTLVRLHLPLAVWANTRTARETEVRRWLARAGIERFFTWVVTSVDAGARKPDPGFFEFALARCGASKHEVLFVGNQLSTDIRGAEGFGVRTVWLSGADYHSDDDQDIDNISPTYAIRTLGELPSLLRL